MILHSNHEEVHLSRKVHVQSLLVSPLAGIVTETGTIRGCYSEDFDGVTVTDKIRELLVNTDTENAHIFSADQQRELIFHLFKALCVGGAICQPSENLDAYMRATKALYKARNRQ